MKVLHFYKTFFPETYGGVEQVIDQLAQGMKKFGVESEVLTITKQKELKSSVVNGYHVYRSKSSLSLASTEFSVSAFKDFYYLAQEADIIHYHFPNPFADVLHFFLNIKKPTVVTYHSDIVKQKNLLKFYKPLMNKFLKNVDCIVATSDNYVNSSDLLEGFKEKTKVIPIGINKASYPLIDANKLTYWENKLGKNFFLFVGVLRYYKGLYSLLDAAKGAEYKVVIIGSGGIEQELQDYVKEHNIDNVIFLGAVSNDDKVAIMQLCLSVVLPSHLRSEAFGISLLEGAMYGKPLVSCEIGTGTTFINQDGVTGLVAEPENSKSLREKMDHIWNNPITAHTMGENALVRYNELFTADRMVGEYYGVYEELVRDNKK